MTTIPATVEHGADRALKSRHPTRWTTGCYPAFASQVIFTRGAVFRDFFKICYGPIANKEVA